MTRVDMIDEDATSPPSLGSVRRDHRGDMGHGPIPTDDALGTADRDLDTIKHELEAAAPTRRPRTPIARQCVPASSTLRQHFGGQGSMCRTSGLSCGSGGVTARAGTARRASGLW